MMFNNVFIMTLLSVTILFSYENQFGYLKGNNSHQKITLNHSPFIQEISEGYTRITKIDQGYTTEVGMPEVPIYTTFFQLDPQKLYEFDFVVNESYTIDNIKLMPHQGMDNWESVSIQEKNLEFYTESNQYPLNNMIISEPSQGRGIQFVQIQVIPYSYNAKDQRLEVFTSVEINVNESGVNPNPQLEQPLRSYVFDQFYKDIIVNFETLDSRDEYQASSILYICGGSSLTNSYVQDLIEWRHKQGYIVNAVSESEVGGSSASTTEIRNYIANAYANSENPPEIVGLIGDTEGTYSLPCFNHNWEGYNGPTDFDYTQLDNSGDLIPEIFIGRISAASQNDLQNQINKIINYEKGTNVSSNWFRSAALAGDPDESGNSTIYTNQYIENLMINHGVNRVETDYDGSGVQTFMETQFNAGVAYYNYRGWYVGYGSYPTNDINSGWETPFVTTITCGTGDFDGNASSEEFVRLGSVNNPNGAVAAVGMATTGTHTLYNNIVNMGIYEGIFTKKLWYAGAATTNGDLAIVATYPDYPFSQAAEAFSKWSNLMGDPALHLWSGAPTTFNIIHPASIPYGTNNISVTVNDNSGNHIEGARVTLLMGSDIIFESEFSDENGNVILNWDSIESGNMYITVIKRDHRPYEGTIEIQTVNGAALASNTDQIIAQSGEYNNFQISLKNYGNEISKNIYVELISDSDNIEVQNNNISFGDLDPGATALRNFIVYLNGIIFENDEINFMIKISDSNNEWINLLPVNLVAPNIVISELIHNSSPGVTSDATFYIGNTGSQSLIDFTIELLPYENLISFDTDVVSINNIASGENLSLDDFQIHFSDQIINGAILPLELFFTSNDGYSRSELINISIGETRDTDPIGPDSHGYYIYDSGDTEYSLAPVYDWIEIAEGQGTQLSISDSGHGCCNSQCTPAYYDCGSTTIDLPFDFQFYGLVYDQIVVNTNGWISFGDFEMYSFRNYPIPGAGGPSPMVAAFWDDLKTGSGGYVHYYESDDMVVIQWDDMRTFDSNSRETFQIILYNSANSPTGDNDIKIQYQDFNNTTDGQYDSGWNEPPYHGGYSTVGIESHLGDMGLQYTYNNTYTNGAATLEDGSAIFITTSDGSYLLGDLNSDGILNVLDIVVEVNLALTGSYNPIGDMNGDGIINVLDIVTLVNLVLNG